MHPFSVTQDPIRLPVHVIRRLGQNLLSAWLTSPMLYDGDQSIAQRSDGTEETEVHTSYPGGTTPQTQSVSEIQ